MTTSVNDTIERYVIAGAGPYPYTWRIFNNTDLQVYALSTASPPVPVLLTYLTHYTVDGVNDAGGGSITLLTSAFTPYAGYTLDIRSNTPESQPTSIRNIARFLPEIHEDAYDNLSRQIQDLDRRLLRAIRFPDNTVNSGEMTPLSAWLSKYLAIDGTGALSPAVLSSTTMTASIIAALFSAIPTTLSIFPRTAAEIAAAVVPTNFAIPSHEAVGHVDLRRYGWVTSTSVDQTAILTAAYAVASAALVPMIIPSGNTKFTATFVHNNNVPIRGENREKSVLLAAFVGLRFKVDINGENGEVSDFTVDQQSGSGNGCEVWNGGRFKMSRMIFQNHTGIGVLLRGGNLGKYADIKTVTNTSDGFKVDSGTGYGDSCWDCEFHNIDSRNNGGIGFNLNAGQSHQGSITTQNNTGVGLRINSLNNDIAIYSENNTGLDIQIVEGIVGNILNVRNANTSATVAYATNNLIIDGAIYRSFFASNFGAAPRVVNSAGTDVTMLGGGAGAGATGRAGGKLRHAGGDAAGTAGNANGGDVELEGGAKVNSGAKGNVIVKNSSLRLFRTGIAYSASMTPDASGGNIQAIRANSGVAFAINAPLNPQEAIPLTISIVNISGGALGAVTWNAIFKLAAWTQPANAFSRSITFYYDGTNWIESSRTPADVPN